MTLLSAIMVTAGILTNRSPMVTAPCSLNSLSVRVVTGVPTSLTPRMCEPVTMISSGGLSAVAAAAAAASAPITGATVWAQAPGARARVRSEAEPNRSADFALRPARLNEDAISIVPSK